MSKFTVTEKLDMAILQDEFAKYLAVTKEKTTIEESTSFSPKSMFSGFKKRVKQKIESTYTAIVEKLDPDEVKKVQNFMEVVKCLAGKEPVHPPMKRPEGLELNLIGVALFSGNESVSKAIRYVTNSSFSHVALLLHDIEKEPANPEGWYIYSANGSASQIMADHRLPQVQLEKWSECIDAYEGAVVSRQFVFENDIRPTSAIITELVDKYMGLPYENQFLIMFKAMNRRNVEAEDHAKSAFCSEICYRFLAAAKIVEDSQIPENVWPKDFGHEGKRLKLQSAIWAEEIIHKGIPPPKPRPK